MVRMSEACPGQSTNVNWTVRTAQLRRLLLQPSRRRHAEAAEAQVDGDAALLRLRVLVEAGRAGDRAERARQRRLAAVDVAEHADVEIEHALVHSDDIQVAEIKTISTVIIQRGLLRHFRHTKTWTSPSWPVSGWEPWHSIWPKHPRLQHSCWYRPVTKLWLGLYMANQTRKAQPFHQRSACPRYHDSE